MTEGGRKRRKGRPVGETIGGIIVGFDQQIMRTLPPPHELVLKGAPVRGLTAADGGPLEISFPDEPEDLEDGEGQGGNHDDTAGGSS